MSNSSNVKSLRAMVAEAEASITDHETSIAELRNRVSILNQAIEVHGGSAAKRRGRPAAPKSDNAPAASARKTKKRVKNKVSMHNLVCEILSKSETGMKLPEVVKEVVASGYKTTANNDDGKAISRMVSQALWKLKSDENPVVIRNNDATYTLAIKAAA